MVWLKQLLVWCESFFEFFNKCMVIWEDISVEKVNSMGQSNGGVMDDVVGKVVEVVVVEVGEKKEVGVVQFVIVVVGIYVLL